MRSLGVLVGSLLLAACPGVAPTGGDDTAEPDAAVVVDSDGNNLPGNGLSITFQVDSPFPISTTNNAIIQRITLRARSVRATGDAASGDSRTTQSDYVMLWNAMNAPAPIAFAEAPIGMYSKVQVQLERENGEPAFEIDGRCERNGNMIDFEIESDASLLVDIPIEANLAPGGSAAILLHLDANALVSFIDWDDQNVSDGEVSIDDDNTAIMAQVVAAMRVAFKP